jgi:hypothetical protein
MQGWPIEILFKLENFDFVAQLDSSLTAQNIVKLLPLESVVGKWGDEIFFDIKAELPITENRTKQVNIGDVAFCPDGNCLCVFFGPTPASILESPIPENPVVIIGRVTSSADKLKMIKTGEKIKVSAAQNNAPAPQNNDYDSGRKLSQAEIDVLVKQLLEEKKKPAQ